MLLERTGFEVYFASDGQQVHEIYMGQDIDIVVTDLRLPKINGRELIVALREWFPGAPIIVTSAVGHKRLAEAKGNGAFEALSKPVDPHEFLKTITMAVSDISRSRLPKYGS
jgi:CheY-like chemotaxis protein